LIFQPAHKILKEIRERNLSPIEVVQATLEWAQKLEGKLRSFLALDPEGALAKAFMLEEKLKKGEEVGLLPGFLWL